jgi:hypothetical protein
MHGVGRGSYYRMVWAHAWRDTVTFLKAQILVSLLVAVLTALVTGVVSAGIGEQFNVKVAVYAAVVAAAAIALVALVWNLVTVPWRLHEELAARLQAFERRPDVGRLVQLREEGSSFCTAAWRSWSAPTTT